MKRHLTRREFLGEAGLLAAVAAARSGARAGAADALAAIRLGKLEVSRLVLGSNPFFGFAHGHGSPKEMRAYYTDRRIMDVLDQAAGVGITAVAAPPYPRWVRLFNQYLKKGGRLRVWIAQPDPAPGRMKQAIADAAKGGAKAIFIQGARVDEQFAAGRFDVLREWLEHIRSFSLPAGMASHRPDVHLAAEKKKLPTDFYFQCFFKPGSYRDEERAKAVAAIRRIDKPVVGYKILAAGRRPPEQAFAYAFRHLRAKDGVCVGVYPPPKPDMIREDAALTRKLSGPLTSRPAGRR